MRTGHLRRRMHSLSCLLVSQIPHAITGIEESNAIKLINTVMLLLTAIGKREGGTEGRKDGRRPL